MYLAKQEFKNLDLNKYDDWPNLFIDNKGNCLFMVLDEGSFQINGKNQWIQFKRFLKDADFDSDMIDIIRFGQGIIVIKYNEHIMVMKYKDDKIVSSKIIDHKAVDIEDQCDLQDIIIPKNPRYLILVYDLDSAKTIIVWDIQKNLEYNNFLGRKNDNFLDYINGKNSPLGFL